MWLAVRASLGTTTDCQASRTTPTVDTYKDPEPGKSCNHFRSSAASRLVILLLTESKHPGTYRLPFEAAGGLHVPGLRLASPCSVLASLCPCTQPSWRVSWCCNIIPSPLKTELSRGKATMQSGESGGSLRVQKCQSR